MGGNRFNVVVDALYHALPPAGVGAVRFDFSSSDTALAAALTVEVIDAAPTGPMALVGYSFGAGIATMIADERLAGWFLIAPPLRPFAPEQHVIAKDDRAKAICIPALDQFFPPAETRQATAGWSNTTISVIPDADHFLAGSVDTVVTQVLAWLRSLELGPGDGAADPST
jgi:alpha/beta superfamily hydrolase